MNVVIFGNTPVAGALWQKYICFKKYSNLNVRLVNQRVRYADGRVFPKDLMFDVTAIELIKRADVIELNNYLPPFIPQLIDKRRQLVVGVLHSVPRQGNWNEICRYAHVTVCIRQPYQVREYKELQSLPNLFDIFEFQNKNLNKINLNQLKIIFAPSNRYPLKHPASKGYNEIIPILRRFCDRYKNVTYNIIERMSYLDNLNVKKNAHIIIDDLVAEHNTFHLTSLEGASFGKVVLTGIGKESGYPFLKTTLKSLEKSLIYLVNNPKEINFIGNKSRDWILKEKDPRNLVKEYEEFYKIWLEKIKR